MIMDVTIGWQDEAKMILRLNCSGRWCWRDLDERMDQWLNLRSHLNSRFCILVDLRKVTDIPNDAILHLKPAVQFAQEEDVRVVVVAVSATAVTMFKLFVTMYKSTASKFQLASTEEEALALLTCTV